jgi:hypothetical protein
MCWQADIGVACAAWGRQGEGENRYHNGQNIVQLHMGL